MRHNSDFFWHFARKYRLNRNCLIDAWLNELKEKVIELDPDLIRMFEIYAAEAKFGRKFIENNLKDIPSGSRLLEVGAGSMMLSCQLVIEGYSVSAIEPDGNGFSHMSRLRQIVLAHARKHNCLPKMFSNSGEKFIHQHLYDFAFSVNVMEHVENVENVIKNVMKALKVGSFYRFTCPNYLFPYEPHFNIPTLFNKSLTWLFFKKIIMNRKDISDNLGLWESINWISFIDLFCIANKNKAVRITYNKKILNETLERVVCDKQFSMRRSLWLRLLIEFIIFIRLHKYFSHLPLIFQPIIDCSIKKQRLR